MQKIFNHLLIPPSVRKQEQTCYSDTFAALREEMEKQLLSRKKIVLPSHFSTNAAMIQLAVFYGGEINTHFGYGVKVSDLL
jgi:hypothetical protein